MGKVIVLGSGEQLLAGGPKTPLRLLEADYTATGALMAVYIPDRP